MTSDVSQGRHGIYPFDEKNLFFTKFNELSTTINDNQYEIKRYNPTIRGKKKNTFIKE